MKYVATVEIEFETDDDPLETVHEIMVGCLLDHYHITEQPQELK